MYTQLILNAVQVPNVSLDCCTFSSVCNIFVMCSVTSQCKVYYYYYYIQHTVI